MTWDDSTYFCVGTWLKIENELEVTKWINSLQARGQNEMEEAITTAFKTLGQIDNVIVICDGDVSPFNESSWTRYRNKYPETRFHFVAVGSRSDFSEMKKMASIGNGSFTGTNL